MHLSKEDSEDPLYRPGVGMIILNNKNKIFVGQRIDSPFPAWQMPQGGIDKDEDLDQAMLRELEEEIGTRNVKIVTKSKCWYKYDLPQELSGKLWKGRFKGQKQIWFILRFYGKDEDINIHTSHPEFRNWKWADKDEVIELAAPFKRELYTHVFNDLWDYVLK